MPELTTHTETPRSRQRFDERGEGRIDADLAVQEGGRLFEVRPDVRRLTLQHVAKRDGSLVEAPFGLRQHGFPGEVRDEDVEGIAVGDRAVEIDERRDGHRR